MSRLSNILGGPRIWIKRDDSTGLAFGGSKVRALEYTLADAISKGADTIITMGEIQSNHTRLTAAAARKLGLKAELVIAADAEPRKYEGNLYLCRILGADIRYATWSEHSALVEQTVREVNEKGNIPYILPFGGSSAIGIIAYINASIELQAQAKDMGIEVGHIIHASTSGGLQTGLTLGNKMMGTNTKVIGVGASRNSRKIVMEKYMQITADICRILNIDLTWKAEDLSLINYYSEENDDTLTDQQRIMNAIMLVAQTEGIVLDPEYTGKAMAVLIDMVKEKHFKKKDNVVFIHTGGTPALFVQTGVRPYPIQDTVIRLYRKYGRQYRLVKWFRNILPVSRLICIREMTI